MLTDVVQSSAVVGGAGWNPTTECSNNILIPYIYKCTFKDQRGLCVYSRRNKWDVYSVVAQGLLDLSVILVTQCSDIDWTGNKQKKLIQGFV